MINRSKMRRQLYTGGGVARQGYGLGSLVKKAFRGIKQIAKSPIGQAALLYGLGGGTFFGKGLPGLARGAAGTTGFQMGNIMPNVMNYMVGQAGGAPGVEATKGLIGAGGKFSLGKSAIAGSLALAAIPDPTGTEGFNMAQRKGEVEGFLRRYYKQYKGADWQEGWNQDEEDEFVNKYTSEYNQGGRVGLYGGGEAGKSLEAGAPDIMKTGNMETEDSDEAQAILMARYNPGSVFSSSEITRLYRDSSLTTNMDRKQLHKILKNPGMFPDAENELKILLRRNQATGGRVGAFGGGVMGGRVGLKVLRDLFEEDDEEEAAQGGRIGYIHGGITHLDGRRGFPGGAGTPGGYDGGGGFQGGGDGEDRQDRQRAAQAAEQAAQRAAAQRAAALQATRGPIGQPVTPRLPTKPLMLGDTGGSMDYMLPTKPPMLGDTGGSMDYILPTKPPKKMNQDGLEFIIPGGQSEEKALYDAIINDVDGVMSEERKSAWLKLLVPQLIESGEMSGEEKDELGMAQGGRIGAFGGGVMGIGTPGMRLPGIPQMAPDGLEYNMKAGGFQNLGAQEGKDDVNAKLAKNEFVMTADAVRGAGGGNIEVGAQRMYDTMKQLEGKVA